MHLTEMPATDCVDERCPHWPQLQQLALHWPAPPPTTATIDAHPNQHFNQPDLATVQSAFHLTAAPAASTAALCMLSVHLLRMPVLPVSTASIAAALLLQLVPACLAGLPVVL